MCAVPLGNDSRSVTEMTLVGVRKKKKKAFADERFIAAVAPTGLVAMIGKYVHAVIYRFLELRCPGASPRV